MELVEAGYKKLDETYELKTVQDGWVKLRRLNHGESNQLTDLRLQFTPGVDDDDESTASARSTTKVGRHYSFSQCITDHNLGLNGTKFDFKKRRDVDNLDLLIGDEIAQLIDTHNETIEGSGEIPNSKES